MSASPIDHFRNPLRKWLTEGDARATDVFGEGRAVPKDKASERGSPEHLRDLTYSLDGCLKATAQHDGELRALRNALDTLAPDDSREHLEEALQPLHARLAALEVGRRTRTEQGWAQAAVAVLAGGALAGALWANAVLGWMWMRPPVRVIEVPVIVQAIEVEP